jgi:hypothetical protein
MVEKSDATVGAAKGIAGFILGALGSRTIRWVINKYRKKYGLPTLEEKNFVPIPVVETTTIVVSAIHYDNPAAPFAIGLSAGSIFDQYTPLMKKYVFSGTTEKDALPSDPEDKSPAAGWDVHEYELKPSLGPKAIFHNRQYTLEEIGKLLRLTVVKETQNRVLNKTIPPGYKHPLVIYYAKQALREANVRGDDPIAVANAVNSWVRKHVPYSYDPQGPKSDEDWFWHPYRILETYDPKTGKTQPFDCDCQAILVASMLMALGYKPIFTLFAQQDPMMYGHIITCIILPPKYKDKSPQYPYYPIEATQSNKPIDYTPKYLRRCVIEVIPGTIVR